MDGKRREHASSVHGDSSLLISVCSIQVNCISTGLLAVLLLPILNKTAAASKPHLVIVSSEVHEWAKFKVQDQPNILEALNDKAQHVPGDRYNISKCMLSTLRRKFPELKHVHCFCIVLDVFLTRELAKHSATSKIYLNTPNPGLCLSELVRDMPWAVKL